MNTHTHTDTHMHSLPQTPELATFDLLTAHTMPQVSSALVFAVFCPLSTSLQYWWGLEVQPAQDTQSEGLLAQ